MYVNQSGRHWAINLTEELNLMEQSCVTVIRVITQPCSYCINGPTHSVINLTLELVEQPIVLYINLTAELSE